MLSNGINKSIANFRETIPLRSVPDPELEVLYPYLDPDSEF
jgi:hypothetical protein